MDYKEITVTTTHDCADLVSLILIEEGSEGVSVKDINDVAELYSSDIIWDYIDKALVTDNDKNVYVKGFFAEDKDLSEVLARIDELKSTCPFDTGTLEAVIKTVGDEDWKNEWRKYYQPIFIGGVTIVPKWLDGDYPGAKVLIEPGNAFGTGNHETTCLCIELMQEVDPQGKLVFDVGCGSGILGIAAAKLGARACELSDIDEDAVKSASDNAELNGVQDICKVICADLKADTVEKCDLLIANITADILIRLEKQIYSNVRSGGNVIISGIINDRAEDVLKAYNNYKLIKRVKKGEWQAFLFEV